MDEREKALEAREKALLAREKQLEEREKAVTQLENQEGGIYSKINISLKTWNKICAGLFSLLVVVIIIAILRAQ